MPLWPITHQIQVTQTRWNSLNDYISTPLLMYTAWANQNAARVHHKHLTTWNITPHDNSLIQWNPTFEHHWLKQHKVMFYWMTMSTLDWMSFCQHSTSAKIGIIVSIRGKFTSKNDNLLNGKDITTNLERKFKIPDPHVLTTFSSKKLPLQLSIIFQEIPKNIVKFSNTWQIHI